MRLTFSIGVCVFACSFFNEFCFGGTYGGGSGTQADPYQIATKAHLEELGSTPSDYNMHFIMTVDIDLSGTTYTTAVIAPDTDNSNVEFDGSTFTGIFDGGGHRITGLVIDDGGAGNFYLALFGQLQDGEIKNLGIEGCSVSGRCYVGALVGYTYSGSVWNSYSAGYVSGSVR